MTNKVLSLDLSTTSTGWSVFDKETKDLLDYGIIKPKVKGVTKLHYPIQQLYKMRNITEQILDLIFKYKPTVIVVEEVNKGISRLGQKVLSGLHFVILDHMEEEDLRKVHYIDSDGKTGWRSAAGLNLILSKADKTMNAQRRKMNKKLPRNEKLPIINKKHLACDYVNKFYKTNFDVITKKTDEDICDSIGLGHYFLHFILD